MFHHLLNFTAYLFRMKRNDLKNKDVNMVEIPSKSEFSRSFPEKKKDKNAYVVIGAAGLQEQLFS